MIIGTKFLLKVIYNEKFQNLKTSKKMKISMYKKDMQTSKVTAYFKPVFLLLKNRSF